MFDTGLRLYTGAMAKGASMMSDVMGVRGHYQAASGSVPGFSADFKGWLLEHGYGEYAFAKASRPGFGGKRQRDEQLRHEPVVFVHGNGGSAGDWREAREAFLAKGYEPCELYAFTYDDFGPNATDAMTRYHSREFLEEVRAFIEAVKEYTGAQKVDVIAHSLGVTLARGAIKGGSNTDLLAEGKYDLGAPLTSDVDTFVGVAGANRGLSSCAAAGAKLPVCGLTNGLSPGSRYLARLNSTSGFEGSNVYSVWSTEDDLVGSESRRTSPIPGEDASVSLANHSHYDLIKKTGPTLVSLVRDHDPSVE